MTSPAHLSLLAKAAANTRWAQTPGKSARGKATAAARSKSPGSLAYHLERVPAEVTDPAEREAAARNAHRAYMQRMTAARMAARAAKQTK